MLTLNGKPRLNLELEPNPDQPNLNNNDVRHDITLYPMVLPYQNGSTIM